MSGSTPRASFDAAPFNPDEKIHRRQLAEFADRVNQGKMNVTADITLAAGAASTTVKDPRIGYYTAALPMPMTANAGLELGNGTLYIAQATMTKGQLVITHANNAQADRTFRFALFG